LVFLFPLLPHAFKIQAIKTTSPTKQLGGLRLDPIVANQCAQQNWCDKSIFHHGGGIQGIPIQPAVCILIVDSAVMSSVWRRSEEKRGTEAFMNLPFRAPSVVDFWQSPTVSVSKKHITWRAAQLNDVGI